MSGRGIIIQQAIDMALAHAKEKGIQSGTICATRNDSLSFEFLRVEGDKAIVSTVSGDEERPLDQVFDVNLVSEIAERILAELLVPPGAAGTYIVTP